MQRGLKSSIGLTTSYLHFVEGLSFGLRRDKELLTFVEFVEVVGVRPHKGEWIPERGADPFLSGVSCGRRFELTLCLWVWVGCMHE